MISLVLSMVGARRVQALTVLLLCVFATAAAVAAPVALRAVDRGVVTNEVGAATGPERSIALNAISDGNLTGLEDNATGIFAIPGFDSYFSSEHFVLGLGRAGELTRVAFRAQICPHLKFLSGRCFIGRNESIVGSDTATRLSLRPGDSVRVQFAHYDSQRMIFVPAGPPATLAIVGVYTPVDTTDPYWGSNRYFTPNADGSRSEPLFTDRRTVSALFAEFRGQGLDLVAASGTLTVDRLDLVRGQVEQMRSALEDGDQRTTSYRSELPSLLDRIDRSRSLARGLMPVMFVPLVALCWFVIYLAVGYGVFGRRHEIGLVALRGVTRSRRWWLASGETAVAILAGAPLGYLLGHVAVREAARWRWHSTDGSELSWHPLPYAAVAVVGALAAAQLGLRAELRASVVDLLRRVPGRGRQWRSMALEGLVVVLGVLAAVQLRGTDGGLTGISVLVPGLTVAAVALVAARVLVPMASGFTRMALRRGRLGSALAAAQLARRPGSQRLLVLISVAVALLCFVAASSDVAARARRDRAAIESGAHTVVLVGPVDGRRLMNAVRTVDPAGAYAMGVGVITVGTDNEPPRLAVDTSRLAVAAEWRSDYGAGTPADLARVLRPSVGPSVPVRGKRISVDLDNRTEDPSPVTMAITLAPVNGGPTLVANFGELRRGPGTYTTDVARCADECRLVSLAFSPQPSINAVVVLHELRQEDPDSTVVSAADFADPARWWSPAGAEISREPAGLVVQTYNVGLNDPEPVMPTDVPAKLPVAATGKLPTGYHLTGNDRRQYNVTQVATPASLPRLGSNGVLVDLEYLERASPDPTPFGQAEVWLGPAAPADTAERLRAAGLSVFGVQQASARQARLDRQGPALALWFHLLAAGFSLVLALGGVGLVAVVDRRRRAEDLRALRHQGLPRRFVRRATLWGQLFVVGAGVVVGLGAGAAAWLVAGDRLPVGVDNLVPVRVARWPDLAAVGRPWGIAAAALILAAVVAAFDLRRAVARPGGE